MKERVVFQTNVPVTRHWRMQMASRWKDATVIK